MRSTLSGFKWSRWGKGIIAGILLAGAIQLPAMADSATGTHVRVAMYLDLGSTYKSTIPAVTLKADSSWGAGPRTGAGDWIQLAPGQSARFSVDGYKVKALESADWKTVSAAVKKLQGTTDKPVAFARNSAGGTIYEVYTGPYANASEAQKAVDRVAGSVSAWLKGQNPSVHGNYYVSAGSFGSQGEAQAVLGTLSTSGSGAFVVMTGPQQYAVWVGGAASEAEQGVLQAQLAQTFPQMSWSPVSQTGTAIILHSDVTLNLDTPSPVDHYELSGNDATLLIRDGDDSLLQLVERSGRKYRGDFEISRYNGQLALVNEVQLEQYLYSVLGAEMSSSWPQESLKAQAVAARSYALYNVSLNKYKVAGLVDTTLSQVYNGAEKEADSTVLAVDSTAGEVMMADGKVVEGIFSSNSGGVTADSTEAWNSFNPVYSSVPSKEDEVTQASLKSWYHVLLSNGATGYVREDNTAMSGGSTAAGLSKLTVSTSSVMVRPLPLIQSDVDPVAKLNPGDQAIVLDKVDESSAYSWIRGPYSSAELLKSLKGKTATEFSSPIMNLEITQRGPSGRVTQVKANGQILDVKYPDAFRSALNGLPSTLFDIATTGRYTVQSAGGVTTNGTAASGTPVLTSSGVKTWTGGNMVVMDGNNVARVIDQSNEFLFVGKGFGHGIGMSQWGAKGMAEAGYDYRQILQHYYQNVTIVKE
ncbi:stage II sporulation protein D [Fontibacillus phaseoli]|uniref:Stage II sporulation protein D n=1 Tax=Fontibacillus phaseoli TaxID=1416533 RepID=A0A369BPR7_9BACL|nr:SpoIID/LytB domain-containing protein [Fontibacillus phaseoli]RCX22437.1 stage II sporulation protein D [Fontibacillus phaseoli]